MVSNNINAQRFKEVMRKYGRTGIITYLGLSTLVTTGGSRSELVRFTVPAVIPMHVTCVYALALCRLLHRN